MTKPRACIVTRMMTIDIPWYSQWLEHHLRLGFTHFHLHYCDDVQLPLEQILSFFPRDMVTLTKLPKRLAEIDLIRDIRHDLKDDYVLYIDSDEFLMLPSGQTVGDYLARHPGTEQFRFRWTMCVSDNPVSSSLREQASAIPSYRVAQHKSMTRRDLIMGVGDTHDHLLLRPLSSAPHEEEGAFILHFASRGLIDPYLKAREQGLANNHAGDSAKLARFMDPSAREIPVGMVPKRLLAALGEVQCENDRHGIPVVPTGSVGTEFGLLARLVSDRERHIFSIRWQDLKNAGLFRGFAIRAQPKYEVWTHLEPRLKENVVLTRI